jgi:energy-coupling factor transporter transmembrane protein EcfT
MENVFAYQEGTTFLHRRLHPLTKMIIFLVVMILSGLWLDVRYLAPLLLLGFIMAYISKTPARYFVIIVVALGLTWFPTVRSTIAQARPEYFKVLDPQWASTPILVVNVPFLGLDTLGLTYGSLYWLAGRIFRFATVVTWAIVFLYTTSINEIANTLYVLKVPYPDRVCHPNHSINSFHIRARS